jgi:thiol:disulfide interchange protein DsbD
MKRIFALLLLPLTLPILAAPEDELLEPEKAFALSTRVLDAQTLEASWKIAPGYYMYRDKFRFELIGGGATLKPAVIPPGKVKSDPTFGSVETHVKLVTIRVPVERQGNAAQSIRVRVTGQGCNEPIGVCYPPLTQEVSYSLPPLKVAAAGTTDLKEVGSLKDLARSLDTGSGALEPVDPEKAFVVSVEPAGADALKVRFEIADCCYLYRDKVNFELVPAAGGNLPDGVKLGTIKLPTGKTKVDEFIGKTEVYTKPFEVKVPVKGLASAGDIALKVGYQGCSEKGVSICYPPTTKTFAFKGGTAIAAAEAGAPASSPVAPARTPNNKFIAYVLGAFGIGLLLTFTPCVLPMIPILSSVIVGSAKDRHISKLEGGMMSSAYVLGTAATYTIAGVIAGATGEQLQAYFQNPVALTVFAAIFVLLALSMFGFYELQMPSFIQSHLHSHSHDVHSRFRHLKGGALIGLFGMGMLSALIVGACVSPLLISALGVAIANRDPVLGGAIMFSMALGMGVILIAIGVGAGFLLPKAGTWMNKVKHVFGVLLLGLAIYLLGFIPQVPVLLLWAALLIIVGVYLGATQSLPHDAGGWQYLWKGMGTVTLIWGVAALLGGFAGNRDIMSPLPINLSGAVAASAGAPADDEHLFERVKTLQELNDRLAQAKAAGKPVLLDYYADWCTDCLRMEKSTFRDARVREQLKGRFALLQADVTDPNDAEVKALKKRFDVFGPPAMLFFGADGAERRELRAYGFRTVDDFLAILGKL